jgi:7-cyano-7-deazaguanine synthase
VAASLKAQGYELHALTFNYGQRHRVEVDAAVRIGAALGVKEHIVVPLPPMLFDGASALTGEQEVVKDRPLDEMSSGPLPDTFVPGRNLVFFALAAAYAARIGASVLAVGVNALDYSGYPDCRPAFINAMRDVIALALADSPAAELALSAPLVHLSKAEVIKMGAHYKAPLHLTHSCYDPIIKGDAVEACGRCDSCLLRKAGFKEAGVPDPTVYAL